MRSSGYSSNIWSDKLAAYRLVMRRRFKLTPSCRARSTGAGANGAYRAKPIHRRMTSGGTGHVKQAFDALHAANRSVAGEQQFGKDLARTRVRVIKMNRDSGS